jgi:hypothetical protein
MRRRFLNRLSLGFSLVVLALAAGASSALADVTIGQLAPAGTPSQSTFSPVDRLQPTVTSGTPYVVPALPSTTGLVIKSWSYNATGGAAGQMMTMKVFRKVGDPATYQAVGHDGPRPIVPGLNTFPTNVPVSPGDVLGTNQPTSAATASAFSAPGDSHLFEMSGGDLQDGQATSFQIFPDWRLNISAVVGPQVPPAPGGGGTPVAPGQAAPPCGGKQTTIIGTDGPDRFAGTAAADVISALGGNDTVSALGANDVVCGGAGKDTLNGGKGKDSLLGQKGKDRLKGGGGKDLCKGGKGNDSASKCEVEKSI